MIAPDPDQESGVKERFNRRFIRPPKDRRSGGDELGEVAVGAELGRVGTGQTGEQGGGADFRGPRTAERNALQPADGRVITGQRRIEGVKPDGPAAPIVDGEERPVRRSQPGRQRHFVRGFDLLHLGRHRLFDLGAAQRNVRTQQPQRGPDHIRQVAGKRLNLRTRNVVASQPAVQALPGLDQRLPQRRHARQFETADRVLEKNVKSVEQRVGRDEGRQRIRRVDFERLLIRGAGDRDRIALELSERCRPKAQGFRLRPPGIVRPHRHGAALVALEARLIRQHPRLALKSVLPLPERGPVSLHERVGLVGGEVIEVRVRRSRRRRCAHCLSDAGLGRGRGRHETQGQAGACRPGEGGVFFHAVS